MKEHQDVADRHVVPEPLRALDRALETMFHDPDRERAELAAMRAALVEERESGAANVIPMFGSGRCRPAQPAGRPSVAAFVAKLPGSVAALPHPEHVRWLASAAGWIAILIVTAFCVGLPGSAPSGSKAASGGLGSPAPATQDAGAAPPAYDLQINATQVSYRRISLVGLGSLETDRVQPVRLRPGHYLVQADTAQVDFQVSDSGRIEYNPSLDHVLSGRDSTTLVIHGTAITVDATATRYSTFMLVGGVWYQAQRPQTAWLLPGPHQVSFSPERRFNFTVLTNGLVDYDPRSAGFLSGRGTTTLTITETKQET